MNEKIAAYIEEQEKIKRKKLSQKLLQEGIYETVYAPIELIGYGHLEGDEKKLKFPVKDRNVEVGDKIKVSKNGEKVDVIIDEIEVIQDVDDDEYPFYTYDDKFKFNHQCKKVPLEISDEEYNAIKEYIAINDDTVKECCDTVNRYIKNRTNIPQLNFNSIAATLSVIALIIYICGFIAGFISGGAEGSWDIAWIVWCASFLSGTMFLGFAEIIKLLEAIKNK